MATNNLDNLIVLYYFRRLIEETVHLPVRVMAGLFTGFFAMGIAPVVGLELLDETILYGWFDDLGYSYGFLNRVSKAMDETPFSEYPIICLFFLVLLPFAALIDLITMTLTYAAQMAVFGLVGLILFPIGAVAGFIIGAYRGIDVLLHPYRHMTRIFDEAEQLAAHLSRKNRGDHTTDDVSDDELTHDSTEDLNDDPLGLRQFSEGGEEVRYDLQSDLTLNQLLEFNEEFVRNLQTFVSNFVEEHMASRGLLGDRFNQTSFQVSLAITEENLRSLENLIHASGLFAPPRPNPNPTPSPELQQLINNAKLDLLHEAPIDLQAEVQRYFRERIEADLSAGAEPMHDFITLCDVEGSAALLVKVYIDQDNIHHPVPQAPLLLTSKQNLVASLAHSSIHPLSRDNLLDPTSYIANRQSFPAYYQCYTFEAEALKAFIEPLRPSASNVQDETRVEDTRAGDAPLAGSSPVSLSDSGLSMFSQTERNDYGNTENNRLSNCNPC